MTAELNIMFYLPSTADDLSDTFVFASFKVFASASETETVKKKILKNALT